MRHDFPILYSFRRCPYAIRARLALKYAGIGCVIREVSLKNKPKELLFVSPKGTVPVLVLPNGQILEESLDIMQWALQQNDPLSLGILMQHEEPQAQNLIQYNDEKFVKILHRYKYPDSYANMNFLDTRKEMLDHLASLEKTLKQNKFLIKDQPSVADLAIFPFIRQVARIDEKGFRELLFPKLIAWLDYFLALDAYKDAMQKFKVWQGGVGELF